MAALAQHNDESDTDNSDSHDSTDHPNSDNMGRSRRVFLSSSTTVSAEDKKIKFRLKELSSILFVKYARSVDFLSSKREVICIFFLIDICIFIKY